MATLDFDRTTKIATVQSPATEITVQEIHDQFRDYEDEITNLDLPQMVTSSGKDNLSGGLQTVVTCRLLDGWRIKFADRAGPSITECVVTQGNLVGSDAGGADQLPLEPANYVFVSFANATTGAILQDQATAQSISDLDDNVEVLSIYARSKKVTSQNQSKLLLTDSVTGRTFEADLYEDEAESLTYDGEGIEVQGQLTETTP